MTTTSPDTTWNARSQELAGLLSRIALGDRRAFEGLYRATSAQLLGIVLRINHDRAQAEEILQEVFVNVWRSAGGFDGRLSQPFTWLTSVARNKAIDSLRRRSAEPATVSRFQGGDDDGEGDDRDLLESMASDVDGPLDLLDQAAQAHALERCMEGLSGDQRSSLALAFYQGLSHAEVAEHLRQPLGTVKSWLRRGLLSLRHCLDRAGGLMTTKSGSAEGAI